MLSTGQTVSFVYLWQAFKEYPLTSKAASKPTNHLARTVFLLENLQGQRSLAGYSPWGLKRVGHD